MKYQARALLIILAVAAVLLSLNIGGYDLWPADEPRFGEVAREMLQAHEYIVLHVNGDVYKEKPPLLFWSIAAITAPFGDVSETTARIPSVVGALLAIFFTFLLAERFYGTRPAIFAAVVLIASSRFWWEARTAQIDMLLTGCLSAALYAFWRHHESGDKKWLLLFYGTITAAVYAKGPPGIVFPMLCVFVFYWRRPTERRKVHFFLGLLAVAALISLWFIPARMMAAPEAKTAFHEGIVAGLYRQTIGRFFLGVSKAEPFWFYLQNLPVDLFPWTFFLPWTIYAVWKRRREGDRMRLLLSWSIPAFIFFTICSGKRAIYILPIYPAFAILIATTILELMDREDLTWVRRTIAGVWTTLLFAVAAGAFTIPAYAHRHPNVSVESTTLGDVVQSPYFFRIYILAGLCFAFGIHGVFALVRKRGRTAHYAMAVHFAGLAAAVALLIFPFVNTFKGASDFCAPLRELATNGKDYRLYSVRFSSEAYIFYSKHFHVPFLVDDWPIQAPAGYNPARFIADQKKLGQVLMGAADNVSIADVSHVSDAEMAKLTSSLDQAFSFIASKSTLGPEFRTGLTKAINDFATDIRQPKPALFFVQEKDWKWLLPFCPAMKSFPILAHDGVGSRQILLLGNDAGAELFRTTKASAHPNSS